MRTILPVWTLILNYCAVVINYYYRAFGDYYRAFGAELTDSLSLLLPPKSLNSNTTLDAAPKIACSIEDHTRLRKGPALAVDCRKIASTLVGRAVS